MNVPPRECSIRLIAALFLSLPLAAWSQVASAAASDSGASSDQIVSLDPYTITGNRNTPWNASETLSGSRVVQNVLDVPASISIITSDYLQQIGAMNFRDMLFYSASGVNERVSYREDYSIRDDREAPLVDGIASYTLGTIPFYDVDRVEIVKGPTSLVYGNFSDVGGSVNYITKAPTRDPKASAEFIAGNWNLMSADATASGPINPSRTLLYRVTAGAEYFGGFKEYEYTKNEEVSGDVLWNPAPNFTVKVGFRHIQEIRRDFNRSLVDPVTGRLVNLPYWFSTSAPWSNVNTPTDIQRVDATLVISPDLAIKGIANWFDNKYTYYVPQPTPGLIAAEYPNYRQIQQRFLYYTQDQVMWDYQLDADWKKDLGFVKNRLNVGWAYRLSATTGENEAAATLPNIQISAPFDSRPAMPDVSTWTWLLKNVQVRSSGWSAYVNEEATLLKDHLILTAGVRDVDKSEVTVAPFESKWMPRYGAVYKITKEISAYGAYGQTFTPTAGTDIFGKPYRDVYGKDEEGGLKVNLFNGHLFGTVDYFSLSNDPVIQQVFVVINGQQLFGNTQTGKQTNKGEEADLGAAIDAGPGEIMVYATAYNADPRDVTGLKPPRAVAIKNTLFGNYVFNAGPLRGFSAGAGVSHYGDQIGTGITVEPAYTLYSAVLGYKWGHWSVLANFDNLTDKTDAIIGSEAAFSVYVEQPFTVKGSVRYVW